MSGYEPPARNPVFAVLTGVVFGALIALPALLVAAVSGGAGHGDYFAARLVFPFSMLLTLVEESIGVVSLSVALLQFPLYGALIGWIVSRRSYRPAIAMALLHLVAAIACFPGVIPNFS